MLSQKLNKQKHLKEALLELSELTIPEIEEQLELIAQHTKDEEVPIYPFYEYILDDNHQKVLKEKKRSPKDAVTVANIILSRMLAHRQSEIRKVSNPIESIPEFCSWLRYLQSNIATEEERDEFLEGYDRKFSYLENIPCYSSIYYSFRKDYIKHFENFLRNRYVDYMIHQENETYGLMHGFSRTKNSYARALKKHLNYDARK